LDSHFGPPRILLLLLLLTCYLLAISTESKQDESRKIDDSPPTWWDEKCVHLLVYSAMLMMIYVVALSLTVSSRVYGVQRAKTVKKFHGLNVKLNSWKQTIHRNSCMDNEKTHTKRIHVLLLIWTFLFFWNTV